MRELTKSLLRKWGASLRTQILYWTCTHRGMVLEDKNIMHCKRCASKFTTHVPIHRL